MTTWGMGLRTVALAAFAALVLSAPAFAQAGRDSAARDTTAARTAPRDSAARREPPAAGVVPADSLPSADARAVLRSIEEPLSPAEQVDAPDSLREAPPEVAAPDTAAADTSGVPIPAETAPLGEVPGGPVRSVFSDSLASAAPGSGAAAPGTSPPQGAAHGSAPPGTPAASPPAAVSPGSAAPAAGASPGGAAQGAAAAPSDTCWRLQLAAPTEREEAAAKRAAAESQLMVGFAIEIEQGRHKVRSRECLPRTAAEALRGRALLSGFADAFLVRMGADGKVIPATPPPGAPAKKPATTRRATGTSGKRR